MSILYSSLKFLRFQEHLEALKNRQVLAPVHVRIKPTNRCNHDCWYCAYKVDHLQLGDDMVEADAIPEKKMREIVDDLIAMQVKAVTFSGGGEPLLYKSLPETIERLALGGVKVASLTNGTNLKGRMADAFAQHATWVRISLDGWDDASFSRIRGCRDGEFSRVVDNIRQFAQRQSNCTVGISYVITQENYQHTYDVCALFKQAGANHIKLSGVVVDNEGSVNNRYHQSIMAAVSEQIQQAQQLNDERFSVVNHYHELEERFDKSYTFCPYLLFLPVIGADQVVYSCHDKAYNKSGEWGSIKDRSFQSFWFSEENRLRMYGLDPSKSCRHHCVAHSRNLAILEYLNIDPDHGVFV
ncbi:MAG: radical SAM protein [Magnetococcales bacterium]|nr:radical SAM protein [Magnetococcales bacterium]